MDILTLLAWGSGGWGDELAAGLFITIALGVCTLPFGLALGFGVALARRSRIWWLHDAGSIFTTIFRGLPELLTLFLIYYGGQQLLQTVWQALGGTYIEANAFFAGMIALGFVFAAFASEVFLSGFKGIPNGQWEGAAAVGLNRFATMRLVIFPQLIRFALPGLANLWLILLKDTALVSVIAVDDLMRQTRVAAGSEREPFFFYAIALLIYLVLSMISSMGINRVERWSERGQAAVGR